MPNYQKMYITLFNAMTDAIESLRRGCCQAAVDTLIRAQQAAEDTPRQLPKDFQTVGLLQSTRIRMQ